MKKKCIICGKSSENGIMICGKEICLECEKAIVNESIGTASYEIYRKQISKSLPHEIESYIDIK